MLNKVFISEEIVFLWQSDTFLCPSLKGKKNVVQQFTFSKCAVLNVCF